jgi:hypothetical protein
LNLELTHESTAYNNQVHLPLSDEGCRGKLTWCGVKKLVNAEVLARLKPIASRGASFANCLHLYTGAVPIEKDPFSLYYHPCETADGKRYICEIPEN